jgi:hypothetical protein
MIALVDCALESWSPRLGDASIMGWVTTGIYLLAAMAAAAMALRGRFPTPSERRERVFWMLAATLLAFLTINKQLDLQTFFTELGRCMSHAQGWYDNRRAVQRAFIIAVAGSGVVGLALVGVLLRGTLARTGLAVLGLGFVSLFVVIRAASFHGMDALIGSWIGGVRVNWALELPGPLLVLVVALRGLTPTRR